MEDEKAMERPARPRRRRWRRPLRILLLLAVLLLAWMFAEARRMPVLRETVIELPRYPAGARPLRVALLGDTHMGGPDQSPARLRRIVAAIDALHPDLILLAGDYKGEPKLPGFAYSREEGAAPLAGLHAPLGVVA